MSSGNGKSALIVEFIGSTGVGKSTLVAAVAKYLSAQGFRVRQAEEAILACYGLAFLRGPLVRSVLVHLLALGPFARYRFTREGFRLSRLAVGSIKRGAGNFRIGASLLRNFWKRLGAHLLLEGLRDRLADCDFILWDEGAVHAAHNLFVHAGTAPDREDVERFARMVPKPNLLVWVTAPVAQAAGTILRRGHSRVNGTAAAARAFAEHAQTAFEVLSAVEGVRERLYRIENPARGPDESAAAIQARASLIGEFLKQRLQGRREEAAGRACASADLRNVEA